MKNIFRISIILIVFAVQTEIINSAEFHKKSGPIHTNKPVMVLDSIPPDNTGMRELTSLELAKQMVPGINVGNSLEAIGGETAWGNPKITQILIDNIKAAGFNSVRIPVAWSNGMDTSTFKISQALLGRVDEVINYVLQSGMYAIIRYPLGWGMDAAYLCQAGLCYKAP